MKYFISFLLACLSYQSYGQTELGELMTAFDSVPPSMKLSLINSADNAMVNNQSDSMASEYFMRVGIANGMSGNSDSSLFYLQKSIGLASEAQFSLIARCYNGMGNVHKQVGRNDDALRSFQTALSYIEGRNDRNSRLYEGSVIGNIAGIYFGLDDMQKAEEYTLRALAIAEKYDQISDLAYSYVRLALIYSRLNRYDDALEYHQKASTIIDKENLEYIRHYNEVNLAKLYEIRNELNEALSIYYSLFEEENSDSELRGMAFENAAKLEFQLKNYRKSIEAANRLMAFANKNQTLPTQVESARWLYKSYQELGEYSTANRYMDRYIILHDSLINTESMRALSELETKYESEKKEQEITGLKLQNQQTLNQRNIYIFLIILVVLGLVFLVILVRSKTKTNHFISNSLKEKETLLREIHHRVKNNLQVISSLLSLQSRYIEDKNVQQAVNEGQNRVKSMALIHQKLYQKENLAGVEALDYIQNLTSALRSTYGMGSDAIDISFDVDDLLIDVDTIIPMGLILNELISNSFKYAFPVKNMDCKLEISLKEIDEVLILKVKDNGQGADHDIEKSDSFGIKMIKSLAMKLEAEVSFNTKKGAEAILRISNYKLI